MPYWRRLVALGVLLAAVPAAIAQVVVTGGGGGAQGPTGPAGGGIAFGGASGGTNNRVLFTGATGLLTDDADMTFVTDTLSATKLAINGAAALTSATVPFAARTTTNQNWLFQNNSGTARFLITNDAGSGLVPLTIAAERLNIMGSTTYANAETIFSGASTTNPVVIFDNFASAKSIAQFKDNSATVVDIADGGKVRFTGNGPNAGVSGSAVASATALPAPVANYYHVTGTTTITSITTTGLFAGTIITLIFDGALTFTDGSNLKLAGDFVTTADDTITLMYDGTNFYEVARSVN